MINDIVSKVNLHKSRLQLALKEIGEWDSIDSDIFKDFEKIKVIDTFIYRFIKLQDIIGEKLFKVFLNDIGEYRDNMSLLDVLDKLEKFEIVDSANRWIEYRKLRNQLTHEYPNNEDEIIDGIKIAIDVYYEIETVLNNIYNYIDSRKKN